VARLHLSALPQLPCCSERLTRRNPLDTHHSKAPALLDVRKTRWLPYPGKGSTRKTPGCSPQPYGERAAVAPAARLGGGVISRPR
jgi:hypothetical protein